MIGTLSLTSLAHRFGGTLLLGDTALHPDEGFAAINTDSRDLQTGELFVALRGERFDGHEFLAEAAQRAYGLVVDTSDHTLRVPQWVVADTVTALGQIAQCNRERFGGPVIAITGSSGKTTVKEMTAAILSRRASVLATSGNLNNHIGVPLTLLRLDASHRYAVIEMGASDVGEIASYCQWARPDVALVNNVAPAHLKGFGSLKGIAQAKGEIYQALQPDGLAVINLDEPFADSWLNQFGQRPDAGYNVLSYGINHCEADVRATDIGVTSDGCYRFRLHIDGEQVPVALSIPGRHNVMNALAAACCAHAVGVALADIAAGLATASAIKGRMQVRRGAGGSRLIDDSYNANPGSLRAAIDTLVGFAGRRILVLGDMGELGTAEQQLHHEVGRYACEQGVDELWSVGPLSKHAASGFGGGHHFDDRSELAATLRPLLEPGVTVLVKGSRSAGMEAVVTALTEENT